MIRYCNLYFSLIRSPWKPACMWWSPPEHWPLTELLSNVYSWQPISFLPPSCLLLSLWPLTPPPGRPGACSWLPMAATIRLLSSYCHTLTNDMRGIVITLSGRTLLLGLYIAHPAIAIKCLVRQNRWALDSSTQHPSRPGCFKASGPDWWLQQRINCCT